MSVFSLGKICVFSEVKLHLQNDGKSVANAKVVRQWQWNKLNSDEGMTDENGDVSFPSVYESSISRLLPVELVIGQQLSVFVKGKEIIFWTNSKREPEENAEYGGAVFDANCELSSEEVLIEEYGSLMVTMCRLNKSVD